MINAKMIARIMGALFFIEAGFLILCSFLAVYYNESDISAFLYSAAITAGAGSIAALAGKNAEKRISRRDGYVWRQDKPECLFQNCPSERQMLPCFLTLLP
jgi:trk system potassium uptake protein